MSDQEPVQPKRSPEGEVVYRRVVPPDPRTTRESRLDPTLLPLVIGFAVLLLLVIGLGRLSVRRLEDTSRQTLDLEHSHAARANLLLQLRIALTRLDNEARDRMEANARHELTPPFSMRLDTAHSEVERLLPELDHIPLNENSKWPKFRADLAAYNEITRDMNRYSQDGFAKFRDVSAPGI
jgi:hypothetical protein